MYLVRAYKPSRTRPRPRERAKCSHARIYRRLHKAPWLLATSMPHKPGSSRKIKQLYAQRMQIEETFRDTKSHRWGFGRQYARCNDGRRLEVLLLIAALASLVLWLVGLCGRALDWSRRLQPIRNGDAGCSPPFSSLDSFYAARLWTRRPARLNLRWRSSEHSSWPPCPHELVGIPQTPVVGQSSHSYALTQAATLGAVDKSATLVCT
jgi:hypothetical protein